MEIGILYNFDGGKSMKSVAIRKAYPEVVNILYNDSVWTAWDENDKVVELDVAQ